MVILYGLQTLLKDPVALFESGYFSKGQLSLLNDAFKLSLKTLRPHIVPITEIYLIPDESLLSAVGNSYGDIYETHLKWAKSSRLNNPATGSIQDGWEEYMMPILRGKL